MLTKANYNAVEMSKIEDIIQSCEKFFRGPLFGSAFPKIDPAYLIDRIKKSEFKIKRI